MSGWSRRLFFCLGAIVFVFLAGCSSLQSGAKKELPYLKESPDTGQELTSAFSSPGGNEGNGALEATTSKKKTTGVILYFADKNGYLVASKKDIPAEAGVARLTLRELCLGPPAQSGLYPTLPAGTQLKDISIKNGLARVDFNKNLKTGHKGGSSGELLTVYSIVNTLTQFPAIKEVQILIDGQVEQTLAGHLDISKPLKRDPEIIRSAF